MKRILLITLLLISLKILGGQGSLTNEVASKRFIQKIESENESRRRFQLIEAIKFIESRNNPLIYNLSEEAAGILQIRPIMVREINRLVGYKKYTFQDRWDTAKSVSMFIDLQTNIQGDKWDLEKAARIWNGGYNGMEKIATSFYWNMVKNQINKSKIKEDGKKILV